MRRVDLANIETASNETTRNINRNLALNLIRARQPISRAELARLSGLQRSTVSLIVEQLIREKWVVEGARGRLPRGRRPTFLKLNELRAIIVADVHPGSAILALADVSGNLQWQETIALSQDPKAGVKQIVTAIKALVKRHPDRIFEGIGISVPGGVDDKQQLIFAPNLKWTNFDIRSALERGTGLHVELENAANTCVLGEIWFGQTSGVSHMAVVAVAEGIGVGVISNGHLVRGLHGMAGEFGHVSMDPNGPLCQCGARGCWEMFASNRAAERYYQKASRKSSGPSFAEIMQLTDKGDALAQKALEQMAVHLGLGLRMIVAAYAPETIMISGEFAKQWHRYGTLLEESLRVHILAGAPPRLIPSRDGALSRLRGGIALVLQRYSSLSHK
ncbi:ROK family transcriptional regulator [Silvibacterium acidisoli]|uniref:ROK family transcriptional regulator n=1 Tax=Acidobacteriaceae bacterium ZG23-2 TaxID=2883246 RepID=UPI00406D01F3